MKKISQEKSVKQEAPQNNSENIIAEAKTIEEKIDQKKSKNSSKKSVKSEDNNVSSEVQKKKKNIKKKQANKK